MEHKVFIRKSTHFWERYRPNLTLLGLIAVILAIPLTMYVLNKSQDIRQRAAGVAPCNQYDYFCLRMHCQTGDTACIAEYSTGWAKHPWSQCKEGDTACYNDTCGSGLGGEKCRIMMASWNGNPQVVSDQICNSYDYYCIRSSCKYNDIGCSRTVASWLPAGINPWQECVSGDSACYSAACNNTAGGEACRGMMAPWSGKVTASCPQGAINIGGIATSEPSAITFNNKIFVAVLGSDDSIYLTYTSDGKTYDGANFTTDRLGNWKTLQGGGRLIPSFRVSGNQLFVQVKGTDGAIYEKASSDGFTFGEWSKATVSVPSTKSAILAGNTYSYSIGAGSTVCAKQGAAIPQAACNSGCTSDTVCAGNSDCPACRSNTTPVVQPDFTKLTGSNCPRNFAAKDSSGAYRDPDYPDATYRLAAECMNKGYCVVAGFDEPSCPQGANCSGMSASESFLGGKYPLTRRFAAAFIARYHVDVVPAGDPRHWEWVSPTGGVFKDMPVTVGLVREVETAAKYGFIGGNTCNAFYSPGHPYYSTTELCFGPEANWLFGFKGIEKSDYFNGGTPKDPWNTSMKRGDFLKQLYDFGTSASHPDLKKCMIQPGEASTCQAPASCNSTCIKDQDCASAASRDGCTSCQTGKCQKPTPACNSTCSQNSDCSAAQDGCTTCNSTANKCMVAACNVACNRDSDCAGVATKDGCISCLGGKCSQPFNTAACKCDGMDITEIGTGQEVTLTAYSKIEGADTSTAAIKSLKFHVYRGGPVIQNDIAQSPLLKPNIIESTPSLIRYSTNWKYTVPADADNGDFFRIKADIQCVPRSLALSKPQTQDMLTMVMVALTKPIRDVLGVATGTDKEALQIKSFYPGEVTQRDSCYVQFMIKK